MTDKAPLLRTYRVGGLHMASSLHLPEVPEVSGPPEWSLRVLPGEALDSSFPTPLREALTKDGQRWMSLARDGGDYLLRFWGYAQFRLKPSERSAECTPERGLPSETLRHLFLDQVVPLILSACGKTTLHASGVLTEWGVLAFLGGSGAGKSTLAGSFAVAGFPVVSDDCLVLEVRDHGVGVLPMYPGLRLWPDSFDRFATGELNGPLVTHYGFKRRLVLPNATSNELREAPLTAILILDDPQPAVPVVIEPASSRDAFMEVFRSAYRLDAEAPALASEFDRLNQLVASVIIARLRIQRDFSLLPEVCETLRKAIGRIAKDGPARPRTLPLED